MELNRVTKVMLELTDGTVETYPIQEDDGVACFVVSKSQGLSRVIGYSHNLATGLILLDEMVQEAKELESSLRSRVDGRYGGWIKEHQN